MRKDTTDYKEGECKVKVKLLLAIALVVVLLAVAVFVLQRKGNQPSVTTVTTVQQPQVTSQQAQPQGAPTYTYQSGLQALGQVAVWANTCPACRGAGYWLKLPRDLCAKCHGYGKYKIVYIKVVKHSGIGEIGQFPFAYQGRSEEVIKEEWVTCEQCNGTGIYWNPLERCSTCGGRVTPEWLSQWKTAAYQAALQAGLPVYEERKHISAE